MDTTNLAWGYENEFEIYWLSDDEEATPDLKEDLQTWTNKDDVTGVAVDGLLHLLHRHGHSDIPSTSRTSMKSSKTIDIKFVSGMEYYHFGFRFMCVRSLQKLPKGALNNINTLILSINIDGVPFVKSTNCCGYPVLCCITNVNPTKVFPISISVGNSKPSNLDFLQDAIDDLNQVIQDRLEFEGKHFVVLVRCIICDAPAKAMVKCIKQYSGYYGCDKCCQSGQYIGRMTYPEINVTLRTNTSFRNHEQKEHHKGDTPLLQLQGINMIDTVAIDYLHQSCFGVMRKKLFMWTGKHGQSKRAEYKLSATQVS